VTRIRVDLTAQRRADVATRHVLALTPIRRSRAV
jgi:hypothetical protein